MNKCTITHEASGIRLAFNSGSIRTYANAAYLAEELADHIFQVAELRKEIAEMSRKADNLRRAIDSEKLDSAEICKRLDELSGVPF